MDNEIDNNNNDEADGLAVAIHEIREDLEDAVQNMQEPAHDLAALKESSRCTCNPLFVLLQLRFIPPGSIIIYHQPKINVIF